MYGIDGSEEDAYDTLKVRALTINDSCTNLSFLAKVNELIPKLIHLSYVSLGGTHCFDTSGANIGHIKNLMSLSSLKTLYDSWGILPEKGVFPDPVRNSLEALSTRCPPHVECNQWLRNLAENFHNLKYLQLNIHNDVYFSPEVVKGFIKIHGITFNRSKGNVVFCDDMKPLKSLKILDLEGCANCNSLPLFMPDSIAYIDISSTKMEELPLNLSKLKRLRYLDISFSKIKKFPPDFNFLQLDYFAADEAVFTDDEWANIEKIVANVKKGRPKVKKREYFPHTGKRQ